MVLGQVAVDAKANESTAIPQLLRLRALEGGTVTIEAMGGQTAIAGPIVAQGGDYILALKDTQANLYAEVQQTFAEARGDHLASSAPSTYELARTVDKDHGRREIRRYWPLYDADLRAYLDPLAQWANVRGIGLVDAERHLGEAVTVEQRYYLLSAPLRAATFGQAVRHHWAIENRLH